MNRHQFVAIQPMRRAGFQGFNIWAVSLNLLVMALRAVPSFMKYLTIKDLITRAAEEYYPRRETVTDLRVRLAKLLNTNQIYDTSIGDSEVYRERGASVIDANYEKRFPLFWILDGFMKFEDLLVEMAPTGRT